MSGINERRVRQAEEALDKLLEHGGTEKQILAAYCVLEVDAKLGMAWQEGHVGFSEVENALRHVGQRAPRGLRQWAEKAESDKYRHLKQKLRVSPDPVGKRIEFTYSVPIEVYREEGRCIRFIG
jgi:hypothetical protein